MNCILCHEKEADQTGSHITSCFLVSSMLGKRDYERGYIISTEDFDYAKNRKADEIKEDNILCKGCESRLSYLEGYFSSEYTNKIDKQNFKNNFPYSQNKQNEYHSPIKMNPLVFNLMINSVIWRAHHSTKPIFAKFRIPKQAEKEIRLTLDKVLPPYENSKVKGPIKKWIRDVESVNDVKMFPYVILRTERKEQDLTENIIYFSDVEKNPFHIIVNEFIILPFMIGKKINFAKQDFFELNEKYNLPELLNDTFDKVKIGNLKLKDWRHIRDKIYNIVKEKYKWKMIISDCIYIALQNGFLPTKKYMNHCIHCRKNLGLTLSIMSSLVTLPT